MLIGAVTLAVKVGYDSKKKKEEETVAQKIIRSREMATAVAGLTVYLIFLVNEILEAHLNQGIKEYTLYVVLGSILGAVLLSTLMWYLGSKLELPQSNKK